MAEKKLEEQLVEAGKRLQTPPSDLDELLPILYQVENCLLSVEQSPSKSVLTALEPSRDALVARELLTHSDQDVKVAVASCISEITRITAPDAPYSDDLMKEIFQIIVGSFEDLNEMSSPSYSKRVSILETVAKVRSCVVMLDLECDDLILKMFQYFLETIRENHPDNVFTSMETIMTLVLEESEDISSELLSCLLSSVKKEKQDVSPVAYKLGERVITKCAAKMKPYLLDKVQSRGFSLESYSKLVATICQVTSDAGELNDLNSPGNQLAEEIKLSERSGSDETPPAIEKVESEDPEVDPAVSKVPITVTTNGTVQIGDELISPKKRPGHSRRKMKSKKPVTTSRAEPDQATKIRRNQKSSSLIPSAESTDHSRINITEEAEPLDRKKGVSKEIDNSSASEALIKVSSPSSDREKKMELSSPKESHNPIASNAAHQSTEHEAPAAEAHPKRGRALGKKKATGVNVEPAQPATPLELKGSVMGDQIEEQVQETPDLKLKESEGTSDSEFKTLKDASMNVSSGDINEDETLPSIGRKSKKEFPAGKQEAKTKRRKGSTADLKLKEFEGTSDSEFKTLKDSSKSVSSVDRDEDKTKQRKGTTADLKLKESKDKSDSEFETPKDSSKNVSSGDIDEDEILPSTGRKSKKEFPAEKQDPKTKQRKGTLVAEKNVRGGSINKRTNPSEKSALKASTSDQIPFEGTPKTKLKRKRGAVTEEESEILSGEKLVSSRVKVWWPDDQMFYKGAIVSYDPVKKKHEILYDDGDKEILLLKEERWELVKDDDVSDGEKAADIGNLAAPSEISNKKSKQRDSSSTQGNVEGSSKRVGRGSAGKPKGDSSKSGGKIKGSGSPKSSGKSEEVTTKIGNKSKDETPLGKAKEQLKIGDKSKDDSPKSGSRTKVGATPKSGTKSRDEPARSGRKPSTNGGSSAKAKSGISSKGSRSGNSAKEKSSPAVVVENETKSGTKRRRKA